MSPLDCLMVVCCRRIRLSASTDQLLHIESRVLIEKPFICQLISIPGPIGQVGIIVMEPWYYYCFFFLFFCFVFLYSLYLAGGILGSATARRALHYYFHGSPVPDHPLTITCVNERLIKLCRLNLLSKFKPRMPSCCRSRCRFGCKIRHPR
ncbi:hypothetical protein BDW67DRAFT_147495 [Aspergillus spinulosporus]